MSNDRKPNDRAHGGASADKPRAAKAPSAVYMLLAIVVLGSALGNLSQTAVNAMMADIMVGFGAGVEVGQWLTTSYMLVLGVTPEKAPDEGEYVTMTFESGVPKSINGKEMKVADIIRELNRLGGKHGIGIVDIVENRVVGMKSRGVYETPGGTILMEAQQQLEELVLDRATMETKKDMGNKLAQIVYEGKWFTPLCDAVRAFVTSTQKYVTGEVKFKLYKGNIIKAGTTSPYSLYSESLASFTTGDLYDHHDAEGFITLFGLPLKVRAMKMAELGKNEK